MNRILLVAAAILLGLLTAFLVVIAVELFSALVHPLPRDFGGTQEEMCQHVAQYPAWVLAVVVPAWGLAAYAGAWIAGRIGNLYSVVVVGGLLLAALVLNLSMLPYPLWFKLATLLVIPAATLAASRRALRHKSADINDGE